MVSQKVGYQPGRFLLLRDLGGATGIQRGEKGHEVLSLPKSQLRPSGETLTAT